MADKITIRDCYGNGWQRLRKHFKPLLLSFIIYLLLNLPSAIPYHHLRVAYVFLVALPLSYGFFYICLKAVRDEKFELRDLFAPFRNNYPNVLAAVILTSVILGLISTFVFLVSFLFSVILMAAPLLTPLVVALLAFPLLYYISRVSFVPYLVMDKKIEALKSVLISWEATKKYVWQIFFMILLAIPIMVAGLICLVVGIIPAIILVWLAISYMYDSVKIIVD